MKKVIINTVPHCGTHLVGSVLNLVGFKHASRFDWRSFKNKKISINWRTSEKDTLLNTKLDKNAFYVSVASPQKVSSSSVEPTLDNVREKRYILSHVPFSVQFESILMEKNFKGISMIRDPRDMCLSMLNHIEFRPNHFAYNSLFVKKSNRLERIKSITKGFEIRHNGLKRPFGDLERMLNFILPWKDSKNFILLRFEDLVGPSGGGSLQKQKKSILSILNHLDIENIDVSKVADSVFGNSSTFRKGMINRWKSELNDQEKSVFKEYNKLFLSLDYEAIDD